MTLGYKNFDEEIGRQLGQQYNIDFDEINIYGKILYYVINFGNDMLFMTLMILSMMYEYSEVNSCALATLCVINIFLLNSFYLSRRRFLGLFIFVRLATTIYIFMCVFVVRNIVYLEISELNETLSIVSVVIYMLICVVNIFYYFLRQI